MTDYHRSENNEIRVLVAASSLLVRTGLATLLSTHDNIHVMGQVADDETLADDLDIYRPDVVVYDLGYELEKSRPRLQVLIDAQIPLVVLLPDEESITSVTAQLAGGAAYGVLLRESDLQLLAGAVAGVATGLVVFEPELAVSIMPNSIESPLPAIPNESLTLRESEVLQLIAQGMTNKAIAQVLEISPNTVKFHINAILSKLNAQSRTEAVVRATQLGLIVL